MSFQRYTKIEMISKGHGSEIWKAYRKDLELPVALKIFTPDESMDYGDILTWQALFLNEASVLPWLQHPSILRFYDLAYGDDGEMAIVTEIVAGRSLVGLVVDPLVAAMIAVRLLGAIQYLQRPLQIGKRLYPAIIHGDIKPSNVMITNDGIRLIDFGFSCPDPDLNDSKILGTPRFASPHRLAGGEPTWRDEVYSVGVTGFDLLGKKIDKDSIPKRSEVRSNTEKLFRRMMLGEVESLDQLIADFEKEAGGHNYGPQIASLINK